MIILKEWRKEATYVKGALRKEVPFPDSDLSRMLDGLLENRIIELPPPKQPEEVGSTIDQKYCRYHWVISHPLEKCIMLKERIM